MARGRTWAAAFSLDTRSLAALRLGMALVILYDLFVRSRFLGDLYTDSGFLPRHLMAQGAFAWTSLYYISGSFGWACALFIIHALVAVMLLIGYRTQLMTFACLVLCFSLVNRVPILGAGGEGMLCWLLVWSCFLPLGAAASVDHLICRRRGTCKERHARVFSVGSIAMVLQIMFLYFGVIAARIPHREWWADWSAVHYILHSQFATPLGEIVGRSWALTTSMNVGAMLLEGSAPLLILFSARWPVFRAIVVLTCIFFHFSIGVTIYTSRFQLICMVAWLVLLPGVMWSYLGRFPWCALIARIGKSVGEFFASFLPGRGATNRWPEMWVAQGLALVILAYVAVVNFVVDATPITHTPLLRLPYVKQAWKMMDAPPRDLRGIMVEANLADGSTVNIYDNYTPRSHAAIELIWPTRYGDWMKYEDILFRDAAIDKGLKLVPLFCKLERQNWDRDHAPAQRIQSLKFFYCARSSPPHDADDLLQLSPSSIYSIHEAAYTWTAPSPSVK